MAINTFELCDKNIPPTLINVLKGVNRAPGSVRMLKTSFDEDSSKRSSRTKKKKNSPYLNGEKVQLISRMTEKRMSQKKNEVFSSFPFAANIYRASSDEFKALKKSKQKARKSVLTLPNVPAPIPKACTVSDMNDSDYFNNKSVKKFNSPNRFLNSNRKIQSRSKGYEFYDRDAQRFGSSSHDMLLKNGDGKIISSRVKGTCRDDDVQDVWSVLRNINKFQFRPTPRISDEDSFCSRKKKTYTRKFKCRKGRRLIGTCRTEEVAYVADFEIQSKTSASQSSSFDRVTVINKNDLQSVTKLDKDIGRTPNSRRIPYKPKNLIPLNDKKLCRNPPSVKSTQVKDNRLVAFIKKQNAQMNKIFSNTVNAAAANEKRHDSSYSFNDSIDSSNCLRLTDNEPSNCTLRPKLTHPNEFKEIIYNGCNQSTLNFADKEKSFKMTNVTEITSSEKMIKGTTQVVINNNVNSIVNKGSLKPKPRLVTTMPSGATMPKLTAADIKRRLTHIKFPVVVLGKDELSSSFEVFDYDPLQFGGLNKHVWPFMLEWKKKNPVPKKVSPRLAEGVTNNMRKVNNEVSLARSRDKKVPYIDLSSRKNVDSRRGQQQEITSPPSQKKIKPMRQFKDKMLKLLYKNSCPSDIKDSPNAEPVQTKTDKVDVSTEMIVTVEEVEEKKVNPKETNKTPIVGPNKVNSPKKVAFVEQKNIPKKLEEIITTVDKPRSAFQSLNMKVPGARYPWAKAKWASDFVDNVMRKIKNGSYYGIEEKKALANYNNISIADKVVQNGNMKIYIDSNDVSIQTCDLLTVVGKVDFEQNYSQSTHNIIENDEYDPYMSIPGFDDAVPNLEIKTLNVNQIQVKNCLTNVMVQFDVTVPHKSSDHVLDENSSSSSSFIPLSVTNSNTRVYKCSTTILNAVLPAELCTVIPKLMRNLFDSKTTLASTTTLPNLTISELSECESDVKSSMHSNYSNPSSNPWVRRNYPMYNAQTHIQNNMWRYAPNNQWMGTLNPWPAYWVPPYGWPEYLPIYMSPVLIGLLKGRFGYNPRKCATPKRSKGDVIQRIKLKWSDSSVQTKPLTKAIIALVVDPMRSINYCESDTRINATPVDNSADVIETVDCTSLELYKEAKWIPSIGNFTNLVQKMWNYCKFNVHFTLPIYINSNEITCNKNNLTVDMLMGNSQGMENTMSLTFTNISSFCNNFGDSNCSVDKPNIYEIDASPIKSMDFSKDLNVVKDTQQLVKRVRIRRKSYINLYRKCRSCHSYENGMPLSDITNMQDFTLALGGAKSLCSVFDGCSGQKVLKCVGEMKTWTRDITPGQALLVLLLSNKKETPNLVRFRPVLLQGIAMNRITRATELDMEIEVIERENVQLTERDGIAYIPASVANQNSLFEELCWIAKTTASDYQKPFDESSERLLKALIGKRKALNPSYLRVMARYVGLGLLKTPAKY